MDRLQEMGLKTNLQRPEVRGPPLVELALAVEHVGAVRREGSCTIVPQDGDREWQAVLEAEQRASEEDAVSPWAGEANVEVESCVGCPHDSGEARQGTGKGAGGQVGRGKMPHEEAPRGGLAVADSKDELGGRQHVAP
ncbi:hypothetical protein E2562_035376 [Oryza meyeriana var. granulata]|uniref:Uncharacterized protein n=1 Tax=Oryza meyeriana var. granulata TaxID=110450 RepID=A0A6G1E6Y7_9ORYZ|nr:hypothetical protein E2562_035376 [Oryza meyeriana var. granulata]